MERVLYELPADWLWAPLGKVATLINGRAYKKAELLDSGPTPVLRVGNFFSNRSWYYSDLDLPAEKYCDEGDLLYAWSASFGPKIWQGPKAIYHYHIWKILPSEDIDKKYLFYLLEKDSEDIKAQGNGVGMFHATKGGMEKMLVPLPPIKEQKRIVEKLDALLTRIDSAIEHLQESVTLADALYASELASVFSSGQNKWPLRELNEVAEVARGKSKHRPRNDKSLFGGEYPFIQTGDVRGAQKHIINFSATYNEKGLQQSKLWPKDTICLTIAANIGDVAILGMDACFPDSVVGISSSELETDYLYYFLTTLQQQLDSKANAAAQKNINLKILSEIKIPVPTLDEQKSIVIQINEIDRLAVKTKAEISEKITMMHQLKASILDSAFKGEL